MEVNQVADRMANDWLSLSGFTWWYNDPNVAFDSYWGNINGVTKYIITA